MRSRSARSLLRASAWLLGPLLVLGAQGLAFAAGSSPVRVCLAVESERAHAAGFRKLIEAELKHHRSHQVVHERCETRLSVQLFSLAGRHYLTLQTEQDVPLRQGVDNLRNDLERVLRSSLGRVLKHDPVFLSRDIREYAGLQRALHAVLKKGHTLWRIELFETALVSSYGASFAGGLALSLDRGSDNWRVFSRIYGGGSAGGASREGRTLRALLGGELGLSYEFLPRAVHGPYLRLGLGGQLLIFEGYLDGPERQLESATARGANLSLRGGYRFFRAHDYDLDFFAAAYLPLAKTQDADNALIDDFTPFFQLGMGVGF